MTTPIPKAWAASTLTRNKAHRHRARPQPKQALIAAASERLVARARAHFSRIVLVWPYGGMSADVSGELVGGWTERVPMRRCMSPSGCRGAGRGARGATGHAAQRGKPAGRARARP
jgi:hypothetical protein